MTSSFPAGDTAERLDELTREYVHLRRIEQEYRVTMAVLALVAERLIEATGGESVEIVDGALADTPDLLAWRDPSRGAVVIKVQR